MQESLEEIKLNEEKDNINILEINQKIEERSEIKDQCRQVDKHVTNLAEKSRTKFELLIKDLIRIMK